MLATAEILSFQRMSARQRHLLEAISLNNLNAVKELILNNSCSVNRPCSRNNTNPRGNALSDKTSKWHPICCAVDKGNIEVVEFLISKGAKVNVESYTIERGKRRWFTPLYLACMKQDLDMIRLLARSGADVNKRVHGVQISEEEGASIDYSNKDTYLHLAVKLNMLSVVQTLLECRADVTVVNKFKESPLHIACDLSNPDMVMKLAQHGCLNNECDDGDMTPLAYLLQYNPFSTLSIHDQMRNAILFLIAAGYNIYTDKCWKAMFSRERCKTKDNWHLMQNETFVHFMLKLMVEPLTLKQQCRGVVRQYLINQKSLEQLPHLSAPVLVRKYLSLEKV